MTRVICGRTETAPCNICDACELSRQLARVTAERDEARAHYTDMLAERDAAVSMGAQLERRLDALRLIAVQAFNVVYNVKQRDDWGESRGKLIELQEQYDAWAKGAG